MVDPSEVEKQSAALTKFVDSMGRPISWLRWPYRKMKPPREYLAWKLQASLCARLNLFFDAGLADEPLFEEQGRAWFEEMLRSAQIAERAAWAAWRNRKRSLEMNFLCGRRRRLPWSC